jgi:hypothetical protein
MCRNYFKILLIFAEKKEYCDRIFPLYFPTRAPQTNQKNAACPEPLFKAA